MFDHPSYLPIFLVLSMYKIRLNQNLNCHYVCPVEEDKVHKGQLHKIKHFRQ